MEMLKYVGDLIVDHVEVPGDARGHRIGVRIMLVELFKKRMKPLGYLTQTCRLVSASALLASCAAVMFEVERWTPAVFNTNGGHLLTSYICLFLLCYDLFVCKCYLS